MAVNHPLHSKAWAEFQKIQGHKVYEFDDYILVLHHIPKLKYKIGTVLRGPNITPKMLDEIKPICIKENVIFVKFEPNVLDTEVKEYHFKHLLVSPKVNFYPDSFILDLTLSEQKLLENMHPITRYNIKVAGRHGVLVEEQTNETGFKAYLKLLLDTSKRQGFYIHNEKYHQNLWNCLKDSDIPHIFLAKYQGEVLSAFMIFKFKDKIYYPYGASSDSNRQVMAPNLLMWEVIKWGKLQGAKSFDMWGALPPNSSEAALGFGFHRFKIGYSPAPVHFVGTYDFVTKPLLYKIYLFIDFVRWKILRFKAKLHL